MSEKQNTPYDIFTVWADYDAKKLTEAYKGLFDQEIYKNFFVNPVTVENIQDFQRKNVVAINEANSQLLGAMKTISARQVALAKEVLEDAKTAGAAFSKATSLQEVVDIQTKTARKSFDKAVKETGSLRDLALKTDKAVNAPIQERVREGLDEVATLVNKVA